MQCTRSPGLAVSLKWGDSDFNERVSSLTNTRGCAYVGTNCNLHRISTIEVTSSCDDAHLLEPRSVDRHGVSLSLCERALRDLVEPPVTPLKLLDCRREVRDRTAVCREPAKIKEPGDNCESTLRKDAVCGIWVKVGGSKWGVRLTSRKLLKRA